MKETENNLLKLLLQAGNVWVKHMEGYSTDPNIEDINQYFLVTPYSRYEDVLITKEEYESFVELIKQTRKVKNNESKMY